MGLDIRVHATKDEVLAALEYQDGEIKHPDEARRLIEEWDGGTTRPGSYHGLHYVRRAYATIKGWPTGEKHTDYQSNQSEHSHLINHSDCDGLYVPEEFAAPIWTDNNLSIGSSYRLLRELEEMQLERAKQSGYDPTSWGWRWDAVYIPAVASVVCRAMITFQ